MELRIAHDISNNQSCLVAQCAPVDAATVCAACLAMDATSLDMCTKMTNANCRHTKPDLMPPTTGTVIVPPPETLRVNLTQ